MGLDRFFSIIAGYIDQYAVLPVLYHFGWMTWEELSFDWCLICVYGMFAVIVTYAVCWPLEALFPVERWESKQAVFTDVIYTILSRVGVIPVVTFLIFYQLQTEFSGVIVDAGFIPPDLEMVFPFLFGHPILTFLCYALILDFAEYWRHRLSHTYRSWYALHALHHAQRQMSFWSDDRNHLLDEGLSYLWFFAIGLAIGIPPLQFPLLILALRFVESLSHANIKLSFGPFEPLLVSPRFHRRHHATKAAGYRFLQLRGRVPDLGHHLPHRRLLQCLAADRRPEGRRGAAFGRLFHPAIYGRENVPAGADAKQGKGLKRKKETTFCEQKVAKKLYFFWAVLVSPPPMARRNKNFCAAFFKKRLLSSLLPHVLEAEPWNRASKKSFSPIPAGWILRSFCAGCRTTINARS